MKIPSSDPRYIKEGVKKAAAAIVRGISPPSNYPRAHLQEEKLGIWRAAFEFFGGELE